MPTLRKKWDRLLQASVGLATMLAMIVAGLIMLIIVGVAIVIAKLSVFVR